MSETKNYTSGGCIISTRREMLIGTAALVAAGSLPAVSTQAAPSRERSARTCGGNSAGIFGTTEIASGKVQGLLIGPIWEFKGIPYGAPTGGKNRFMPPKKPVSWTGVRDCFAFGQSSPQGQSDFRQEYFALTQWDRKFAGGGVGEDCLVLNVWTPTMDCNAKKPVFVSFHGGGFQSGSSNAQIYDGKFLAAFGDAVVVTVNHRLSSFGYTHLIAAGAPDEFRFAGVAGMMDLVAALQWVHVNVESFGGDPDRVMIFGNSGGGAKTSALMAMPSAKGLFHRAAIQSGATLRLSTPESGADAANELVAQLGLSKSNFADIQKLPWQQILDAQLAVGVRKFRPVVGTDVLPEHPFDPTAPEVSADVPMIISTTLEDADPLAEDFDLDEADLRTLLDDRFAYRGDEILTLYRHHDSDASPFLIRRQIFTDLGGRRTAQTQAMRKSAQHRAPVWMYQWNWRSPAYDGQFGAIHAIDIPASFRSYRDGFYNGSTSGKQMVDRLSSAWLAFARNGDPNNPQLPDWPSFEAGNRTTMIFDDHTRAENDPRGEIRAYWEANPPPASISN